MSTLHVVNGDSTLATLAHTSIQGEQISWFDFLVEGAPPNGTLGSGAEASVKAALQGRFPAHPPFQRALRLQLLRFPDETGLSPLERRVLSLLGAGPTKLGPLFKAFYQTELGYQSGLGDMQFTDLLAGLYRRGLLRIDPDPGRPPYQDFGRRELRA